MSNPYHLFLEREKNRKYKKSIFEQEEREILDLEAFFLNKNEKEEEEEEKDKKCNNNDCNKLECFNNPNLPIYIQIKIIRIFSEYVNEKMKIMEFSSILYENCSRLKKTISLVNWLWFNTFSKHLSIKSLFIKQNNVSFKHLPLPISNKYSLYKDENIKTLILSDKYSKEYENFINLLIANYSKSLKKIILPNSNYQFFNTIEKLNCFNNLTNKPIKLDIYLNIDHPIEIKSIINCSSSSYKFNISNFSLILNCPCPHKELVWVIENLNPTKLTLLPTIDWKFPIEKLFHNNSFENNKNKNNYKILKEFHYSDVVSVYELKDFLEKIKVNSSLRKLSVEFCFDTLLYRMTNGMNGLYKFCECCQISLREGIQPESFKQFNDDWSTICLLLKDNFTKLNFLSISNSCRPKFNVDSYQHNTYFSSILECGGRYSELNNGGQPFPIEFIEKMILLINSCKNLKKFNSNGFHTTQIFENLLINTKNGNKTIEEYQSLFSLPINHRNKLWKAYKDKIGNLISNQYQIKRFQIKNLNDIFIDEFNF